MISRNLPSYSWSMVLRSPSRNIRERCRLESSITESKYSSQLSFSKLILIILLTMLVLCLFSTRLQLIGKVLCTLLSSLLMLFSPDHKRAGRESTDQLSPMLGKLSQHETSSIGRENQPFSTSRMRAPEHPREGAIDPALSDPQIDREQDQGYKDAIRAWSRFRFVRAGWFTPTEAIEYIN